MSAYFGNAQITIAASSALNAQAGILAARSGVPEPVKEKLVLEDGAICTVLVQERNNKFDELYKSVHHFGPLCKRGWAFQENVLSTRTIHYTDSELVWECCTETISEDGFRVGDNAHSFLACNLLELRPSPSRLWQDLVMNFSRRELTYPSDRLPGVSGLAQLLQKRTGFEYVAGLWRETMVLDLLWRTSWEYYRTDDTTLRGDILRRTYFDPPMFLKAPSWSWVSTTATVHFPPSTDDWLRGQCATIALQA
jgi:hypothetical protein